MGEAIEVLVVEQRADRRQGLTASLEEAGLRVAGAAATAEEGYRRADELLPRVVLVGTMLPDAPGVGAAAELRRRFPALATVVVAAAGSDEELFAAIRAGASAYLGPEVAGAEVAAVVARVGRGEYVINDQMLAAPDVAASVLAQFRGASGGEAAASSALAPLTDRELEILRRVSGGTGKAAVGDAIGVSTQTVESDVSSILRKLAVNDRTRAAVLALRRSSLAVDGGSDGDAARPGPGSER